MTNISGTIVHLFHPRLVEFLLCFSIVLSLQTLIHCITSINQRYFNLFIPNLPSIVHQSHHIFFLKDQYSYSLLSFFWCHGCKKMYSPKLRYSVRVIYFILGFVCQSIFKHQQTHKHNDDNSPIISHSATYY